MMSGRRFAALIVAMSLVPIGVAPAQRARAARKVDKPAVVLPSPAPPPATPPATPPAPADVRPYDPQLFRLAEILGALTYLGRLCGEKGADDWRQRMQALLDAEGQPALRRDRLAGAYNEGLQGYELSYRSCTVNARAVIARFLAEGSRLAQDVENRFRAS